MQPPVRGVKRLFFSRADNLPESRKRRRRGGQENRTNKPVRASMDGIMRSSRREIGWSGAVLSLLIVLMAGVLVRCAQLQLLESQRYRERAERQQLKIIPQTARRGTIVDREGRVMAVSRKIYSVRLDPSVLADAQETARQLSAILDLPGDSLYQDILARQDKRFLWVKRDVGEAAANEVRGLKIRGVLVETEFRRDYPMGQTAGHVLGSTDIDGAGLEGVEWMYDTYLAPQAGKWLLRSDSLRRPIGAQGVCEPAKDGHIVVLTLDSVIQNIVQEELRKTVEKFRAKSALGIVMDPKTGEILALANWPGFDPNRVRETPADIRRNRALTDPIEPGSTFKPFTAASALEGKFVTLQTIIDCEEGVYNGPGFGAVHEYKHYFGRISVADILIYSSNIGSAKMAQKMGKPYFHGMLRKFGFGQKTGIDLPGEGEGIMRPLSQWNDKMYTLTCVGFGQGISVTPIQLVRGFCILANGGKKVTPRVTKGILSPDGSEVICDFLHPRTASGGYVNVGGVEDAENRVISEKISRDLLREALAGVVEKKGGTAHGAYLEEYRIFGKTGTAQIALKDGRGYEPNKYISSFVGGAPVENPRICVLVMVREPDRRLGLGYTGGRVAAPAVREIVRQTLAYLQVPPGMSAENAEKTKQIRENLQFPSDGL